MNGPHNRRFRLLVSALAVAALASPAAGSAGTGSTAARIGPVESVNPILRNDNAHFGTHAGSGQPDGGSAARAQSQSRVPVVVRVNEGFDWAAAGVGAVGGLGFILVAGSAASAIRRRQRADAARA